MPGVGLNARNTAGVKPAARAPSSTPVEYSVPPARNANRSLLPFAGVLDPPVECHNRPLPSS
jgi:hypothetical protein